MIHTATLTAHDAFGDTRSVTVHWMPETVTGVDLALDNVGRSPVVWDADHCPVQLKPGRSGVGVDLLHNAIVLSGTYSSTEFAERVATEDELAPGTFWIAHDTDDD